MEQLKSGAYRAKVYVNGRAITKAFQRKQDAVFWKQRVSMEKGQAEAMGKLYQPHLTFEEFAKIWFENKQNITMRTHDTYWPIMYRVFIPLKGKQVLSTIKMSGGHQLISQLKAKNLSAVRINFYIRYLKKIFNDAVKWDYLMVNPMKKLEVMKPLPRSPTYWLPNEVSKFLTANADDEYYELFLVALNTGLRRSELLGLQWDKVDFEKGFLEIVRTRDRYGLKPTTKTGKIRHVPANETVLTTLRKLREEKRAMDYVFVGHKGNPPCVRHISNRMFKRAIDRAQVKRIRFHDTRTTFAANFCMRGGNIYTLSKILGHSTVEMTAKRYAHLHVNYLKDAVGIIDFKADSSQMVHDHLQIV